MTATIGKEPLSKARLRVWLKLLKATGGIEAEVRRFLRDDHKTTLPRFDVMSALSRFPDGLKMSELSDFLRVSNGNVTGIVDKLTEDGLVIRAALPGDRRAQVAKLTDKGQAAFAAMAVSHETFIDTLLQGLDAGDIAALSAGLDRVLAQDEEDTDDR